MRRPAVCRNDTKVSGSSSTTTTDESQNKDKPSPIRKCAKLSLLVFVALFTIDYISEVYYNRRTYKFYKEFHKNQYADLDPDYEEYERCEKKEDHKMEKFSKQNIDLANYKNIWQTSATKEIPGDAYCRVKSWITWNPQWSRNHLDDTEADDFMKVHFPDYLYSTYSCLPMGVMKADMFRYAAIYAYGGVYADIDVEGHLEIEQWWDTDECDVVIGLENDYDFCQWTFAAKPNHPIFLTVLDTIADKVREDGGVKMDDPQNAVHQYTGPSAFTAGIRKFLMKRGLHGVTETTGAAEMKAKFEQYLRYNPKEKELYNNICFRPKEYFTVKYAQNFFFSHFFQNMEQTDSFKSWKNERHTTESTTCTIPQKP